MSAEGQDRAVPKISQTLSEEVGVSPQNLARIAAGAEIFKRMGSWIYKNRSLTWLALLLFSVGAKVVLNSEGVIPELSSGVFEALAIACVLALLSETPLFRNYVEMRFSELLRASDAMLLRKFTEVAEANIIEQMQDETIISSLQPHVLGEVERAVQVAPFKKRLPSEIDTLLGDLRQLRSRLEIWRVDVSWRLIYKPIEQRPDVYRLTSTKSFAYKQCTDAPIRIDQIMLTDFVPISGFTEAEMFVQHSLTLNDKPILHLYPAQREAPGKQVEYTNTFSFVLEPAHKGGIAWLGESSTTIYPTSMPWVARFWRATKGVSISLSHPATIIPSLYVFGIGSEAPASAAELEPIDDEAEYHTWRYNGWCLATHGMLLLFSPSVAPPDESAATVVADKLPGAT